MKTLKELKDEKIKVSLFVGKFAPFTLGHLKVIENYYKKTNNKVIILNVYRKPESKNIISTNLTNKIFKVLEKSYKDKIFTVIPIESYQLWSGEIFEFIEKTFKDVEVVSLICGKDREKDYKKLVDKYEIDIYIEERTDEDISATKLRDAILNNDTEYIKFSFPSVLHPFIKSLKSDLESRNE